MNRRLEMRKKSVLFVGFIAAMVVFGCKGKDDKAANTEKKQSEENAASPSGLTPEQAALVAAKVGDRNITVGDITEQINKLSPYIRRRWAAPEKRREFLDNLIRVELLSQEAERRGVGKGNPEVERVVDQVMVRLMIKKDLEKDLIPTSIEDSVLKAEYEREKDKYHRPAQIRASHILVKTKAEADKLLADLKDHSADSRYYREAVKANTLDDASKTSGGDLGYFSESGEKGDGEPVLDPALAAAAWKLEKVGDFVSEPVQTDAGFHIVKLTNRRAKLDRSFESVKRMIENRLLRDKRKETMDKFVEDLRAKATVEINEDVLADMKIPQDPSPQGMIGRGPHGPGPGKRPGGPSKKSAAAAQ